LKIKGDNHVHKKLTSSPTKPANALAQFGDVERQKNGKLMAQPREYPVVNFIKVYK
jgi:hypothetical protein